MAIALEDIINDTLTAGVDLGVTPSILTDITDAQEDATQALANAATALAAANEADDTADAAQTTATAAASAASAAQTTASAALALHQGNKTWRPIPIVTNLVTTGASGWAGAFYVGYIPAGTVLRRVRFRMTSAPVGAGTAEVAIASSPTAPNGASPTLTVRAASVTETLVGSAAGVYKNLTDFAYTVPSDMHMWVMWRSAFATTQPSFASPTINQMVEFNGVVKAAQPSLTTLVGTSISTWLEFSTGVPYMIVTDW